MTDKKKADPNAPAAENDEKLVTSTTPGMQRLLDAARATGAKNLVVAGGLEWGYDLAGVLKEFALADRDGHGVVYSSHVYPWKHDWPNKFIAAAEKYPLFLGEVGCDTTQMPFIPAGQQEDPATWAPDMLGCIQKYQLNWTAWCFHPKSTPRVILDWEYKPTPFWGEPVRRALRGEAFEMKRAR